MKRRKLTIVTRMNVDTMIANLPDDIRLAYDVNVYSSVEEAGECLADTEAVVTSVRLDTRLLELAPKLQWVQTLSAGVDKMPIEELAARGITVTNMRGIHTVQMSELALSFMLQWVRRSSVFHDQQREKVWNSKILPDELYGKTVGIIGAGAIGETIGRKAQAFDMRTLGFVSTVRELSYMDEVLTGEDGLNRLLTESDFVVILLPSTPLTYRFLHARHFARMKSTSVLVNLARGAIVDEAALIAALQDGVIAGAALDVFEVEPLPETSPLWNMPNVLITPHVAGSSPHYLERAAVVLVDNARRFLHGEPLHNAVDPVRGY